MLNRSILTVFAAVLMVSPATARAQRRPTPSGGVIAAVPAGDSPQDAFSRNWRYEVGASLIYGVPTGTFHDYVRQGAGLDAFFRWNLDSRGITSIRLDGGWLAYGRETQRVPLSGTIGGRILVDLTTSNNIVHLGIGPQLTVPDGPIRPYINGGVGFSYFFTQSSVEGSNNNEPFANTTNYDDWTLLWKGGGGLLIPFGARQDVALDLGVQYHNNGQVKYLRKGSIVDLPGGGIQINPIESQANLLSIRLGVSARIR